MLTFPRITIPQIPTLFEDKVMGWEINHQTLQADHFRTRERVGEVVVPEVYLPVFEPPEATLVAIFVEPGAVHLVFLDEVAPNPRLDERYREVRRQLYGRVTDVESVEVGEQIRFVNNASLLNLYETSLHYSDVAIYKGAIYSNTWNHMLSARPQFWIKARGGYNRVEVEVKEGDREEAGRWQPE